jgi:hypothetical protein
MGLLMSARRGRASGRLRFSPLDALAFAVRERAFLLNQRRRLRRLATYRAPAGDVDALLERVKRKQLILTVTAGRTGTTYLTRLLALFPDTVSTHEPSPSFVYYLRQAQRFPALAREFLLDYKLPFIAQLAEMRYVETGHLFCKGFFEPLLELGIVPRVVVLRRHPRPIAASLLTRCTVPGRGKLGLKYLLHPGDPGVLPLPAWTSRSDYQLCFWYALEIERRQRDYAARLARAGGTSVDVTPDELHDGARFLSVAESLGLLDARVDRDALLRRHAEVSAVTYNANEVPHAFNATRDSDEALVWEAVAPHAPWLRAEVERRYGDGR